MLEGATLLDPASTLLDADVQVGVDTVIGPGCSLLGNTGVGSGCELRSNVVLRDAVIGDRVLVRDHTVVEASTIGCDSAVGPFSLVRGDSRVGERCKVGASAEINRSCLGDGSKMSIAVETFRLPDGSNWEGRGLTPNIPVAGAWDEFGADDPDPVLKAAIDLLAR